MTEIKKLNTTCSKADEKATLKKIASLFEPGTYLADFFNAELLEWVNSRIDQDVVTDIMPSLRYFEAQANEAKIEAQEQIRVANKTNYELATTLAEMTEDHDTAKTNWSNIKNSLLQTIETANANEREWHAVANDRLYQQKQDEARIRWLETQVTNLKAEIYDLEHAARDMKAGGAFPIETGSSQAPENLENND
jgi:hypothetical protein